MYCADRASNPTQTQPNPTICAVCFIPHRQNEHADLENKILVFGNLSAGMQYFLVEYALTFVADRGWQFVGRKGDDEKGRKVFW